ncbi:hypothetical protein S245_058667 [Arachis hypogaea]
MATMANDELIEILSWLPAKAIHKLKSSSKLFSQLPETPYFVAKQAENSLKKDRPSCFFIQRDDILNHNDCVELHPLPEEELSSGVPENMLQFIASSRLKILSSSNGLLLYLHGTELFIINPQRENLHSVSMTLECDSDDYRLILFDNEDWSSHFDCHVYSHKQGAWSLRKNRFFAGSRDLKFDMPVICNGAIHFISDCYSYLAKDSTHFRPYIMSYKITNGDEDERVETKLLKVPKEARRGSHDDSYDMNIFKWGAVAGHQTICLVRLRKRVFTVWILANYESSSWRRIMKVRVKRMGLVEQNPEIRGFTILNGDLVFATNKKVYAYVLTSEKYMVLLKICDHGCDSTFVGFVPNSDTLRPCGIELPETPYFVAEQTENSLKKDCLSCFFIQRDDILNHNDCIELHPFPGEELSSGVPENMLRFIASSRLKILSSSNDLLLCLHGTELFIINPATCYLYTFPTPNHLQQRGNLHSVSMTLEYDSHDYRLILFDNEDWSSHFDCHVYSHKQGAWSLRKNRFFAGSRDLKFDMPVICNGAIHFISDCYSYLAKDSTHFRPYIMSYKITNGDEDERIETRLLRVPKEARRGSHDDSCNMNISSREQLLAIKLFA